MTQSQKIKYQYRKDNNLCVSCGSPIDGDYVQCLKCRDLFKRRHKSRSIKLKASGVCVDCGNSTASCGTRCGECSRKHNDLSIMVRAKRTKMGYVMTVDHLYCVLIRNGVRSVLLVRKIQNVRMAKNGVLGIVNAFA